MRFLLTTFTLFVAIALISCRKDTGIESPPRKVQFELYTDKDFSSNSDIITFTLSIQNSYNQSLWDSVLAPMKIKDIPDSINKLVFEKTVPNNDTSLLRVGFYYSIENVGNSWYLDSFKLGAPLKIVVFNFQ